MRRSLILDTVNGVVFHSALLLALFLLFSGHNRPGGGFVGGLVAGAAFTLRYVAGGIDEVHGLAKVRPWTLLGTGLLLATASALVPLIAGNQLMDHGKLDLHLGLLGDLHVGAALVFDMGVASIVMGLVLFLLDAFGERVPVLGQPVRPDPRSGVDRGIGVGAGTTAGTTAGATADTAGTAGGEEAAP